MYATTFGLDVGKSIFHVVGLATDGAVVRRRRLSRHQILAFFSKLPPSLIGMEAGCGAHWLQGAQSAFRHMKREHHKFGPWITAVERRASKNVAITALANKLVRIAWAVLTSGERYRASGVAAC